MSQTVSQVSNLDSDSAIDCDSDGSETADDSSDNSGDELDECEHTEIKIKNCQDCDKRFCVDCHPNLGANLNCQLCASVKCWDCKRPHLCTLCNKYVCNSCFDHSALNCHKCTNESVQHSEEKLIPVRLLDISHNSNPTKILKFLASNDAVCRFQTMYDHLIPRNQESSIEIQNVIRFGGHSDQEKNYLFDLVISGREQLAISLIPHTSNWLNIFQTAVSYNNRKWAFYSFDKMYHKWEGYKGWWDLLKICSLQEFQLYYTAPQTSQFSFYSPYKISVLIERKDGPEILRHIIKTYRVRFETQNESDFSWSGEHYQIGELYNQLETDVHDTENLDLIQVMDPEAHPYFLSHVKFSKHSNLSTYKEIFRLQWSTFDQNFKNQFLDRGFHTNKIEIFKFWCEYVPRFLDPSSNNFGQQLQRVFTDAMFSNIEILKHIQTKYTINSNIMLNTLQAICANESEYVDSCECLHELFSQLNVHQVSKQMVKKIFEKIYKESRHCVENYQTIRFLCLLLLKFHADWSTIDTKEMYPIDMLAYIENGIPIQWFQQGNLKLNNKEMLKCIEKRRYTICGNLNQIFISSLSNIVLRYMNVFAFNTVIV